MIHFAPSAEARRAASVNYRNLLTEGVFSWSSFTPGNDALNALGPQTSDYWQPSAMPANLAVVLPQAAYCDSAGLFGHTLGSSGVTVAVQRREVIGGAWITEATLAPEDDQDIFLIFGEAPGVEWRFLFTGGAAPFVSIAWIGPRLLIPGGVIEGFRPLSQSLAISVQNQVTRGGQYRGGYIQKEGAATSAGLGQQDREWVQEDAADFIAHYDLAKPFIFAPCPAWLPDDAHYCWRAGNTLGGPLTVGAMRIDLTLEVAAYVGG